MAAVVCAIPQLYPLYERVAHGRILASDTDLVNARKCITLSTWRNIAITLIEPSAQAVANAGFSQPPNRSKATFTDTTFVRKTGLPISSVPGNFGPYFVPRPNIVPQLGGWYSYDFRVKANTPDQRHSELTY